MREAADLEDEDDDDIITRALALNGDDGKSIWYRFTHGNVLRKFHR